MSFYYVASPYYHEAPLVREERYLHASHYIMNCLKNGEPVFSPIVHCHELAKIWGLPKDRDFWRSYNYAMLERALGLRVLRLNGWQSSAGVKEEIADAERLNIPVSFI